MLQQLLALLLLAGVTTGAAADDWKVLQKTGGVVLLRHMQTEPGVGDPPEFNVHDCATQRNLDQRGRLAARQMGERFRAAGIKPVRVGSSAWCRCRDSATLAFGGHEVLPALNSFFGNSEHAGAQTTMLKQLIATRLAGQTWMLVTHQVNITALTGVTLAMGEAVIVTASPDGGIRVTGRIAGSN